MHSYVCMYPYVVTMYFAYILHEWISKLIVLSKNIFNLLLPFLNLKCFFQFRMKGITSIITVQLT